MLQKSTRRGTLSAMSEQTHQNRSRPDTIVGPAKWFAAGGITIGSAVGLVFAFFNASPRSLAPLPLMNTETVALAPTDADSATGSNVAPVEPPPLTTTTTGPARPLSSTTEALLVPRASTPAPLVPLIPSPASSPATTTPGVTDSPDAAPSPSTPAKPSAIPPKPQTPKPTSPSSPKPQTPAIAGGTINLNTASASELELLPQIGPALAARIIDYRTTHGPFRQLADLDKVKGIGPKTLDKLKGLVRFE